MAHSEDRRDAAFGMGEASGWGEVDLEVTAPTGDEVERFPRCSA
jgi:hypothetical protein